MFSPYVTTTVADVRSLEQFVPNIWDHEGVPLVEVDKVIIPQWDNNKHADNISSQGRMVKLAHQLHFLLRLHYNEGISLPTIFYYARLSYSAVENEVIDALAYLCKCGYAHRIVVTSLKPSVIGKPADFQRDEVWFTEQSEL